MPCNCQYLLFPQDFKNFQYTLGRVTGLVIHMEEKRTLVRLPQDRYDEVLRTVAVFIYLFICLFVSSFVYLLKKEMVDVTLNLRYACPVFRTFESCL